MKLVQINEYGSAEVLKMVERSIPTPKTGELLIKITEYTLRKMIYIVDIQVD